MNGGRRRSSAQIIELFDRYVIGNYKRFPVCLVRGEGSYVWDAEGNRYLDLFPGWGCNLLGHCPPRVVQAVREQVGELIHVPNTWYMEAQGLLAQALSLRSFGGQCFFCNSGAEAVEAAIKLARLWGKPQRYKIIAMLNSFHGRTFGALSATGQAKYHHGFEPMLPGFRHVPFGDADAVADAIDDETCAILVEPVQGEGGVRIAPEGYLRALRELADRHQLVLIFDEVQTGMGRTGKWFAYQHWEVEPDIMTLAKGLAGGVAAGAMIAKRELAQRLQPGMHAATFGGNPIACRAALATVETIEEQGLLERAAAIGERFRHHLQSLQARCPLVREIRILGAMIGIELQEDGNGIVQRCLERRLLVNCTQQTVIRLLPALTITDEQIDEGCRILEEVLLEAAERDAVAAS
ncbi:MAG: aspartate aminotransferase family protein [Gemmatales bacterium]|nr:aspartate aminotransferase family protein [Gemmatales bacterium]MDW7995081.1 aspartate aminotransferase family protein [Gemmatales bacterium]